MTGRVMSPDIAAWRMRRLRLTPEREASIAASQERERVEVRQREKKEKAPSENAGGKEEDHSDAGMGSTKAADVHSGVMGSGREAVAGEGEGAGEENGGRERREAEGQTGRSDEDGGVDQAVGDEGVRKVLTFEEVGRDREWFDRAATGTAANGALGGKGLGQSGGGVEGEEGRTDGGGKGEEGRSGFGGKGEEGRGGGHAEGEEGSSGVGRGGHVEEVVDSETERGKDVRGAVAMRTPPNAALVALHTDLEAAGVGEEVFERDGIETLEGAEAGARPEEVVQTCVVLPTRIMYRVASWVCLGVLREAMGLDNHLHALRR